MFIEYNSLLPDFQFGFRKRSTMYNLGYYNRYIRKNFRYNKYTLSVFLVIKGEFYSINHVYLIEGLSNLDISGHILRCFFFNNRTFSLKVNNKLFGPKSTYKGTPQGSLLFPLLFILNLIDFISKVSCPFKYSFYVDDLVIYLDRYETVNVGESIMYSLKIS